MTLRSIAIDDEPLALELLIEYAIQVNFIKLLGIFTSPVLAKKYLADHPVDLIFLDIQMPNLNGLDFFKSLEHKPLVIFTTAFSDYALEGFDVDAIDYLLKPFEFERFLKAVTKVNEVFRMNHSLALNSSPHIFVRSGYRLIKILLDEIEYIEGLNDYIKIVTAGKKPILTLMPMKEILGKLPASRFARVHRSYIIPVDKITGYNRSHFFLGEREIPVGNTYIDCVKKILNRQ